MAIISAKPAYRPVPSVEIRGDHVQIELNVKPKQFAPNKQTLTLKQTEKLIKKLQEAVDLLKVKTVMES